MRFVVVLVAHGTVEKLEDLPAFVTEIRRGRPPSEELLKELRQRYEMVGGSPLLRDTRALAERVQKATGLECRVAMRLWEPRIEDVVADLSAEDVVCLVPLAPFSVQVYEAAARRALAQREAPPQLISIPPWGKCVALLRGWQKAIERTLRDVVQQERRRVLLTAHSLPTSVIAAGDSYASEFGETAALLGRNLGVDFAVGYQSQGAMAGEWLGPSLRELLEGAARDRIQSVVVAPIGFLSEHIETLYDLDIEARNEASALGLAFYRTETVQELPELVDALSAEIRATSARFFDQSGRTPPDQRI